MQYYVGLDVSLNNTALCIVNRDGDVLHEGAVSSDPGAIDGWLKSKGLAIERVGIEAGATSVWLCHELLARGWPVICIETRHAKAALAAQTVKTDRNDARGIAHIMRTGWFRAVHIKTHESQKLRVLLNNRRCLLDKQLDLQNQIRGTLKVFGLKIGKATTATYDARVRDLIEDQPELQDYIVPMLEVRRHLVEQCRRLENMILRYVRYDPTCRLFMTIPGVGPLTALAFKTFVDCPGRFRHSRAVGAALGLTPRKYASGETDFDGRITKCGDPFVRSHLFEAAKVLLARAGKKTALKAWGLRIAQRSSRKSACVAVARRLAVIMHAMWRDGTAFDLGQAGDEHEAIAA